MAEPTIVCPHCKTAIPLSESLAQPFVEKANRDAELRVKKLSDEFGAQKAELARREDDLAKRANDFDNTVNAKLKLERARLMDEAKKQSKLELQNDLDHQKNENASLQALLKEKNEKLSEAQKAQAEVEREKRKLEDAQRELELTVQRKVSEELSVARAKAQQDAAEHYKLKMAEDAQKIEAMRKQIDELQQKAQQGSQQLQGEVLELELEQALRAKFPRDSIEPVPKGEFGGDIIQRVFGPSGQACGMILWECKRVKNWSDGWLAKLRENRRAANADLAVLVTQAMPKGTSEFELIQDVWVSPMRTSIPIAALLREELIKIAGARSALEGQETKKDLIYQYLTGPKFRNRVQAIVEAFSILQQDLDKEKKFITKQWAKREEQIDRLMQSTMQMHGEMESITGKALLEIETLEARFLAAPDDVLLQ